MPPATDIGTVSAKSSPPGAAYRRTEASAAVSSRAASRAAYMEVGTVVWTGVGRDRNRGGTLVVVTDHAQRPEEEPDQHLAADWTFGPCADPTCPGYTSPN